MGLKLFKSTNLKDNTLNIVVITVSRKEDFEQCRKVACCRIWVILFYFGFTFPTIQIILLQPATTVLGR